jgi:hypothetical protein
MMLNSNLCLNDETKLYLHASDTNRQKLKIENKKLLNKLQPNFNYQLKEKQQKKKNQSNQKIKLSYDNWVNHRVMFI